MPKLPSHKDAEGKHVKARVMLKSVATEGHYVRETNLDIAHMSCLLRILLVQAITY